MRTSHGKHLQHRPVTSPDISEALQLATFSQDSLSSTAVSEFEEAIATGKTSFAYLVCVLLIACTGDTVAVLYLAKDLDLQLVFGHFDPLATAVRYV
jgi:hypothetical protein